MRLAQPQHNLRSGILQDRNSSFFREAITRVLYAGAKVPSLTVIACPYRRRAVHLFIAIAAALSSDALRYRRSVSADNPRRREAI